MAAKRGSSLGEARLAFLRGPGLGLPLAALLGLLLGVRLSPPLVSLGVLLLSLAFQRALRYRLGRRGGFKDVPPPFFWEKGSLEGLL